jgi:hypothetical protein
VRPQWSTGKKEEISVWRVIHNEISIMVVST